jgi:hypothetical protein
MKPERCVVAAGPGFEVWFLERGENGEWAPISTDPVVAWEVDDVGCEPVVPGDRLQNDYE